MLNKSVSLVERVVSEDLMMTHQQMSDEIVQLATDSEAAKYYQEHAVLLRYL